MPHDLAVVHFVLISAMIILLGAEEERGGYPILSPELGPA